VINGYKGTVMNGTTPEQIISRKDADFVFGLRKDEWEKEVEQFFAAGWVMRSFEFDTGKQVSAFDPPTGIGLSIQPLYRSNHDLPDMVIVGNYFPVGVLPPMTDEAQKAMEAAAQKDLGATYNVKLVYRRVENLDSIDLVLTKS
jgi:hypothetical protein